MPCGSSNAKTCRYCFGSIEVRDYNNSPIYREKLGIVNKNCNCALSLQCWHFIGYLYIDFVILADLSTCETRSQYVMINLVGERVNNSIPYMEGNSVKRYRPPKRNDNFRWYHIRDGASWAVLMKPHIWLLSPCHQAPGCFQAFVGDDGSKSRVNPKVVLGRPTVVLSWWYYYHY